MSLRCPIKVSLIAPWALLVCLTGCQPSDGPQIAKVSGVVTLNGTPLTDAFVVFSPKGDGFPSLGQTNSEGYYELTYKGIESGAVIGEHRVGISTVPPESDGGTELIPAKYREQGALDTVVTQGSNQLNFDLEGEAPVKKTPSPQKKNSP